MRQKKCVRIEMFDNDCVLNEFIYVTGLVSIQIEKLCDIYACVYESICISYIFIVYVKRKKNKLCLFIFPLFFK